MGSFYNVFVIYLSEVYMTTINDESERKAFISAYCDYLSGYTDAFKEQANAIYDLKLELGSDLLLFFKAGVNCGRASMPSIPEGWQPIETAPKDQHIIGYWDIYTRPSVMWWNFRGVCFESDMDKNEHPSHWMPLPSLPTEQTK
jgi:hypothetical protein